jgi:hypothetical protein
MPFQTASMASRASGNFQSFIKKNHSSPYANGGRSRLKHFQSNLICSQTCSDLYGKTTFHSKSWHRLGPYNGEDTYLDPRLFKGAVPSPRWCCKPGSKVNRESILQPMTQLPQRTRLSRAIVTTAASQKNTLDQVFVMSSTN